MHLEVRVGRLQWFAQRQLAGNRYRNQGCFRFSSVKFTPELRKVSLFKER